MEESKNMMHLEINDDGQYLTFAMELAFLQPSMAVWSCYATYVHRCSTNLFGRSYKAFVWCEENVRHNIQRQLYGSRVARKDARSKVCSEVKVSHRRILGLRAECLQPVA